MPTSPAGSAPRPIRSRPRACCATGSTGAGGAPYVLELPADRPRPADPSDHGVSATAVLGPGLSAALDDLSRDEGVTPFMTLLAGFAALLNRVTGRDELLVGTPVAGRSRPETEGVVGVFMNLLPLRLRLAPGSTFRDLLRQARSVVLEALGRQEMPFERLIEAIQPPRDPGRPPLVQVEFQLRNLPDATVEAGGLMLEECDLDFGIARFDLSLTAVATRRGYELRLTALADLFSAATAARVLGHYQTLLTMIAADPDRPVATLPLLTGASAARSKSGMPPHSTCRSRRAFSGCSRPRSRGRPGRLPCRSPTWMATARSRPRP